MNEFAKNGQEFSFRKASDPQLFKQYGSKASQLFKANKYKECKGVLIVLFSLLFEKKVSPPPKEVATYLYYWNCILYTENKLEESLLQANINALHFEELKLDGLLAQTLILKSALFYKTSKFQDCIRESKKSIDFIFRIEDPVKAIKPLNNLAASYFSTNQLYQSVSAFYKALEVCKKHKVYKDIPVIQFNINHILLSQERFRFAASEIEKFKETIERFDLGKTGDLCLKACYCQFHYKAKNYDLVVKYANEIETFPKKAQSYFYKHIFFCKLKALIKLGKDQGVFDLLLPTIEEKNIKFLWIAYETLATLLLEYPSKQTQYLNHPVLLPIFKGSMLNLIEFLEESLDENTQILKQRDYYELIAQYYQSINNYKKESFYLHKLIKINHKLYRDKKNDQVLQLQEEYQSEQKQQEIAFQRQLLEEQKLINVKLDKFAQITAHDLKEPLRGIYSFSRLLKNKTYPLLEKKDQESWDFIIDASLRMEALIKDILAFSKMGTNLPPPVLIDLNSLMEKVLLNLKGKITSSNGQVLYPKLPSVWGHEVLFLQLFQNLIGNALKFVPSERHPIVTIKAELQEGYHLFSISDNGIGIPTDKLERVFDAFTRLNKKRQFEGSGLGLATCKKIVETYNGKIWLESQLNTGTNFYFQLPIGQS